MSGTKYCLINIKTRGNIKTRWVEIQKFTGEYQGFEIFSEVPEADLELLQHPR